MNLIDQKTTELLHITSQYLAAANISFLDKKVDDSHTNFGWNLDKSFLVSRDLNGNSLFMALDIPNFRLSFLRKDRVLASKPLAGSSHGEMLTWITEVFRDLSFGKNFDYQFHYEMPNGRLKEDHIYEDVDADELNKEAILRSNAYRALKEVALQFDDNSEVRTWPHHFDTGTLIKLGGEYSIGMGLAVPDNLVDAHYYYVSGWKGHDMMPVAHFPQLSQGEWLDTSDENGDGGWKGAVMGAVGKSNDDIQSFLREAIDFLK